MNNEKEFVAFISHSSVDARTAQLICEYLEKHDLKCWIAPRNIDSGKDYASQIMYGIENSKMILLLLSENSNKSEQVLREVERAAAKCVPILVIQLERIKQLSKSLEYFISQRQWITCYTEFGKQNLQTYVYESILNAVKTNANSDNSFFNEATTNIKENKKTCIKYLSIILILVALFATIYSYLQKQALLTSVQTLNVGNYISLGTYRNQNIIWTIIDKKDINNDSYEIKLITQKPIAYKSFDIAHDGVVDVPSLGNAPLSKLYKYFNYPETNDFEKTNGSTNWNTSTLRTWLNSNEETVKYPFGSPNKQNIFSRSVSQQIMNDVVNINEKGFLTSFNENEIKLLSTQDGKIEDFSIKSNCAISKVDSQTILSNLPKLVNLSQLNLVNLNECKHETYSDLVTIPSLHDYKYYLDNNLSKYVSLSYQNMPRNLVWLKNPCGNKPFEVCTLYTSKTKDLKDEQSIITYVTSLAGVQPIIVLKVPKNFEFLGKGTSLVPYFLE